MSKKKIYSNLDINLSDEEREKEENIRDLADALEEGEKRAPSYAYTGAHNPRATIVTEDHTNNSAKNIRNRRDKGQKIIPVGHITDDDGEVRWLLNDEDVEAVRLGFACENCLEWQKSPLELKCEWLHVRNMGCGYVKYEY